MGKSLENRVEELEKIVAKLTENAKAKIGKKLVIGDTFTVAGLEWKILDIKEKGYFCHAVTHYGEDRTFDDNSSDWKTSRLRKELNENLYKALAEEIGEENIIPFERDLLSMDGQTEYGTCEDKVSILSFDEYRKYRSLIPNTDKYWWLLTPWSTPCNDYKTSMAVVCPSGYVFRFNCNDSNGVRPVCIFSSSIFESENK